MYVEWVVLTVKYGGVFSSFSLFVACGKIVLIRSRDQLSRGSEKALEGFLELDYFWSRLTNGPVIYQI